MNIILFEKNIQSIPLSDDRAKHILQVLKLKEGDTFKMGIINESEGTARIEGISQSCISISYSAESEPVLYPVTLLVAQVRPICMKRILREAVSLGVEKIILTGSQTGEKSYLSSNLYTTGEYKEYLLDGAMQSAHAGIADVVFTDNVKQALEKAGKDEDTSYILLDNRDGAEPLSKSSVKSKAVIAIGPERGWSDYERKLFYDAGYSSMLLGSRVLRTETACSAGVAVLLSRMDLL